MNSNKILLPAIVAIVVAGILSVMQVMADKPMLIMDRFIQGSGWVEIALISIYGGYVTYKMSDQASRPKWRLITWTLFSIVFFSQLLLGLLADERFLTTGDLHLPIPAMIAAGPIYRFQVSFMPILFISTIIISGPAWCSQLCYFGAFDALAAFRKKDRKLLIKHTFNATKFSILALVIFAAIILRVFRVPALYTTIIAASFGIIGLLVILIFSSRSGKMIHCTTYCPIGTIVNYAKFVNPFRFRISDSCTSCMRCIPECKYGALDKKAIAYKKPGLTCTMCGDCISVCKPGSLHYKFPGLGSNTSGKLYLAISIILHALFMALARI